DLNALRIAQGGSSLLLACDLVVGASAATLPLLQRGRTRAVVNTHETITAEFVLHPGTRVPVGRLESAIAEAVGPQQVDMVEATALATALVGDAIATNLFLLGYAWQRGLVPIGEDALMNAIELNGTAVEANKAAFRWGRCAAVDLPRVREIAGRGRPEAPLAADIAPDLDTLIERRAADLVGYQSRRLARKYRALVARVREREAAVVRGSTALTEAVARNYHKLLAYKDEYEVARLYASAEFRRALAAEFEGDYKLKFHLAPPLLAKRDKLTGQLQKQEFGPWMMPAFRVLRHFKRLRGTRLDIFGRTEERQQERALIVEYEALIDEILSALTESNLEVAIALASVPHRITGFGHVKERNIREAATERTKLLERFRQPAMQMAAE
ncbi:MAG: 2-oxoacid:acceptor oxidoreductase family protein, partial [Alphaproteobacteria bacterium]|nr:2-oxoacid:acceptor oxidoreductase family protein [Alphaproteobacteria bacterium]